MMSASSYLDWGRMAELDAIGFRATKPYPWINPSGLITEDGYQELVETLPDVSSFDRYFGVKRSHGQQSHDRFVLNYRAGLELAEPWRRLTEEILSPEYTRFLRRLFDHDFVDLSLHWHYTPNGCSVSPHCDAEHKLGSHIFYLNAEADWQDDWGGETLILDDAGAFSRRSAPDFDDFSQVTTSETLGNRSLLFQRRGNSWHGVRPVRCPEGEFRKVFIVAINSQKRSLARQALDWARGKPREGY
jgi:hypothetical protein